LNKSAGIVVLFRAFVIEERAKESDSNISLHLKHINHKSYALLLPGLAY